jgi:hypothetical protein
MSICYLHQFVIEFNTYILLFNFSLLVFQLRRKKKEEKEAKGILIHLPWKALLAL